MITFRSVTKHFGPGLTAVEDLSFDVGKGELALLTGPSGSGKTTIMRLLTKEYTPTSGTILYNNTPLDAVKKSRVHLHRRTLGVVFQDYRLLPELNIWENIALPLWIAGKPQSEIESRVSDLLHIVGLADRAALFPVQLSGGEAQRVSIARALATAPQVIFADEPTGNLDPKTSESIAILLKKIQELGTTVLFATHDALVLELFKDERRIHLEDGKLVEDTGRVTTESESPAEPPSAAETDAEDTEQDEGEAEETAKEKTPEKSEKPASKEIKSKKPGFSLGIKLPWSKKSTAADSPPSKTTEAPEAPEPPPVKESEPPAPKKADASISIETLD